MLLLPDSELGRRKAAAIGPLAPLADALGAELEPLIGVELYLPEEKALLSRTGGRCEDDGELLDFDPYSPDEHRCAKCGRVFAGEFYHRWWVYWYQMWLAERGVHAALLHLLRGDERHGRLARDVIRRYAEAWGTYPNRDNVLGPSRLFFSTYLESIWLLQICIATDLIETSGDSATADHARRWIIEPSAALIAQYDEGFSNRQVWNNAALMASALVTGDAERAQQIVSGPSGLEEHIGRGLLNDGTWYEGENYHLFAHRGLWYGVMMAETAGIDIGGALRGRFNAGFGAPFATVLPDQTLPSRKDSQYAISLRQPRFAELCELGLARTDDPVLVSALAGLYSPSPAVRRAPTTADVERNGPAGGLTRADLGWRSLLHALPTLPPLDSAVPTSASLDGQGITVFRRAGGDVYVALDWGQSGGGHGHPDRLNLLFSHGDTRWLDDMGTGSYVDPSLHWYRSTLAHNAPLVNGESQRRVDGWLNGRDESGTFGWVSASTQGTGHAVEPTRTLVVAADYFVDVLQWEVAERDESVLFDLPIHFDGEIRGAEMQPGGELTGGRGLEDGFDFVRVAASGTVRAGRVVEFLAQRNGRSARAAVCADRELRLFHLVGPGQPAQEERRFFLLRSEGSASVIRTVWTWSGKVESTTFDVGGLSVRVDGELHTHRGDHQSWDIEVASDRPGESRHVVFGDERSTPDDDIPSPPEEEDRTSVGLEDPYSLSIGEPVTVDLGEEHYRRSDESWTGAGKPTASVSITAESSGLAFEIEVRTVTPVFVPPDAVNSYDNEPADINGHGVQLYVDTMDGGGAWMLVPDVGDGAVRVRKIEGWGDLAAPRAEWRETVGGFAIDVSLDLPEAGAWAEGRIWLDVLINESTPERERRRGQLVMSGAAGEFVYLLGDRHERGRLLPFVIAD